MKSRVTFHPCPAFSLIELLAAMAVLAILSTILINVIGGIRTRANQIEDTSNMRQIGLAIHAFAADREGSLPGPLSGGQSPLYPTADNSQLLYLIGDYLPLALVGPEPTRARIMVSRAWEQAIQAPGGRPYEANVSAVTMIDGERRIPFGYPNWSDRKKDVGPNKLADIASPSETWSLRNLDQLNAKSYAGNPAIPRTPIHGEHRNYLFFDNHVEQVPVP